MIDSDSGFHRRRLFDNVSPIRIPLTFENSGFIYPGQQSKRAFSGKIGILWNSNNFQPGVALLFPKLILNRSGGRGT